MKFIQFLLFFTIAFGIYFSVNYYIYIRGLQAFTFTAITKTVYTKLFLVLALSYIAGRIIERFTICRVADFLTWIGSYWLAFMVYFLLFVILIDIIRIIDHFLPFLPGFMTLNPAKTNFILGIIAVVMVSIIVIGGRISATHPVIREVNVQIPKPLKAGQEITIAMASDIHLGAVVGQRHLRKMVRMINEIQPDLILFAGDIIDEDPGSLIKKDLGQCLRELQAPLGVFTITGNHEYIGGIDNAVHYITEHRITLLRDSVVTLPNGLVIIGREDRDSGRFNGIQRKSVADLLWESDPVNPVILLDHQPSDIDEAVANNIDLQLSGHTHYGQLWPFNMITSKIFKVDFGFAKINTTNVYVSCGFGTWGPPIRTSSRPELVKLILRFGI